MAYYKVRIEGWCDWHPERHLMREYTRRGLALKLEFCVYRGAGILKYHDQEVGRIRHRFTSFGKAYDGMKKGALYGIRYCRALHWDQGYGVCRRVPRGLHSPEEEYDLR